MIEDSIRLSRDTFYVTLGFGVIVFQKLQVRRRELERDLAAGDRSPAEVVLGPFGHAMAAGVENIDRVLTSLDSQLDPLFEGVERGLSPATREMVHQAREVAKAARSELVGLFVVSDDQPPDGTAPGF